MTNKKQRNKAIERKNKNQRRLSAIITGAVVLVILLAVAWVAWDVQSRRWVMTFEGTRIEAVDLDIMAWLLGAHFDTHVDISVPSVRDAVVDELVNTLTLMHRADGHGIGVTAQDIADNLHVMNQLHEDFQHRATELWLGTNILPMRLADHYFPTYDADPTAMAEYVEERRNIYAQTSAMLIITEEHEVLERIITLAAAGDFYGADHFEEFVVEYAPIFYDPEMGAATHSLMFIIEALNLFHEMDEIAGLQQGELSRIVDLETGEYLLIYVVERTDMEDYEMEESFINRRRMDLIVEQLEEWSENANYRLNTRTLNAL